MKECNSLTEKIELAVALDYSQETYAPVVSAKGKREMVAQMKKIARRYGVPLARSSQLAEQLDKVEEQQQIPKYLYREVASLFARKAVSAVKKRIK